MEDFLLRGSDHQCGTIFAPRQLMREEQRNADGSSPGGLEINEDLAFARREWKIQRGGWVFFGLVTVAAVLGLFGRGLWSNASAAADGLHVQYERFERYQRPTKLQLRLRAKAEETAAIILDRAYLDAIRIERITPRPEKVEANARGLLYHFPAKVDPITITFHLELEQVGPVTGQIGLIDGPMLSFNQFVYP